MRNLILIMLQRGVELDFSLNNNKSNKK